MNKVYIVDEHNIKQPQRILCTNEFNDLHQLLLQDPSILPGDQINPDDPRKWIILKNELDIKDPSNGEPRWSLDFLFIDQDATPTFIECKRFLDTRSRREVVAQMIDYAANGQHYITKEDFMKMLNENASSQSINENELIKSFSPQFSDADSFCQQAHQNLRDGVVRLVFFLEDSPYELRSIVDFLNKQMTKTDVLIVEARIFQHDTIRIVVPVLFGFTDEARKTKQESSTNNALSRGVKWTRERFYADLYEKVDRNEASTIENLANKLESLGIRTKFGSGKVTGSINFYPKGTNINCISILSNGRITFNFGYILSSGRTDILALTAETVKHMGMRLPTDFESRWIGGDIKEWITHANSIFDLFLKFGEIHSKQSHRA